MLEYSTGQCSAPPTLLSLSKENHSQIRETQERRGGHAHCWIDCVKVRGLPTSNNLKKDLFVHQTIRPPFTITVLERPSVVRLFMEIIVLQELAKYFKST